MPALSVRGVQVATTRPLEFTIPAGACMTLSGPSGAGKSLLLRAIADLDPHPGEVWLGESAQHATPPPLWRRKVGYLPAESQWWLERVGEHFATLPSSATLEELGFPPDLPTWSVHRLSTGEKQRLGLLRLLALRPDALLLDEPTANLDPVATARVEAMVGAYRQERAIPVLWVSHDPDQAARVGETHGHLEHGELHPGLEKRA